MLVLPLRTPVGPFPRPSKAECLASRNCRFIHDPGSTWRKRWFAPKQRIRVIMCLVAQIREANYQMLRGDGLGGVLARTRHLPLFFASKILWAAELSVQGYLVLTEFFLQNLGLFEVWVSPHPVGRTSVRTWWPPPHETGSLMDKVSRAPLQSLSARSRVYSRVYEFCWHTRSTW